MIPDYNRAARLAYKTILSLHIESFPIDPMMIFSFCKNTVIRTYEEAAPYFGLSDADHFKWYVADNKDALTVRREYDDGTIRYEMIYDSRGNPCRRRFTLAHELGHIVMKHHQEQWWEEKEADYYAAQLLAPHPVFDLFPRYSMNPSDPELIARTFGLSKAASEMAVLPPHHKTDAELSREIKASFEPFIEIMSFFETA